MLANSEQLSRSSSRGLTWIQGQGKLLLQTLACQLSSIPLFALRQLINVNKKPECMQYPSLGSNATTIAKDAHSLK